MKALFSIFFIFLNLICFGQSCEQRLNNLSNAVNNIKTCEQLNYFNNVTFNKSEATKFGNECAMYISENRDKFYAIANKLQTIGKSLDCNGKVSSSNQSNQTSGCTATSQPVQQTNTIINQFKENPIAYANSKTKDGTKLKDEDKKKLLENLESATNIGEFDESKINEILDIKEDNIKVAQEAYHIESRGRSPFFNIVVFSGYKAKFDGILDIDVSIDENGKLTSVSTASKPKDEELNRLVTNYIFEKYSKNREWSPAVGTNGRFISSNLIYKENFHRIIETAKVEQKQKPVDINKNDNELSENNQSYYQKLISFKNSLINKLQNTSSDSTNETAIDNAQNITEQMETDMLNRFFKLLKNPKTSIFDIRKYISQNIKSIRKNTRIIMEDSVKEFEEEMTEIDK